MARRRSTKERGDTAADTVTASPTEAAGTIEPQDPAGNRGADNREDEIARRAYERYEARGGAHGHDQDDWYEAEREVRGGRSRHK
ncbi:MAG: DUF2934 domain-containing protein [Acidobacteria bacterium]|nr:DUF2934 domain-containing protein [Acidobacteriota bacterium]